MSSTQLDIQPLIGMEIHVQLLTSTKLFSSCPLEFGAEPNSRVDPVSLGLPGSLPVLNERAIELSMTAGLALGCTIAEFTKWDRKSYYYPDLPKNYQISQYDLPIAEHGKFDYLLNDEVHSVRIKRAHLEEDAGKNIHEHKGVTCVDLNRAGAPLLEIVTEPDLQSADQAYAFAVQLQQLMVYLGVSEGVMKKGQMRFEPNVNVKIVAGNNEIYTPICEIKNLNSFKAIRGSIAYEIDRHVSAWQKDPGYTKHSAAKENRGWDDDRNITVYQRVKEEAHDYRYFPDPDLVPVLITTQQIDEARSALPESPLLRRQRISKSYDIAAREAEAIVADRSTADLFDAVLDCGADGSVTAKHFVNFWSKHANDRECTIAELGISAQRMSQLVEMQKAGRINATAAAKISSTMIKEDSMPADIAARDGLEQLQDLTAVEALVDEAIESNPKAVGIVRERGKKWEKSVGFLQGQVMQKSKGSAPPQVVREILEKKLGL